MNSIEAIIALLALMLSFSILLGGILFYKNNIGLISETISEKDKTMECVFLIDSFFSNSSNNYSKNINCFEINKKTYFSKQENAKELITEIKKEQNLEVKINEHYK